MSYIVTKTSSECKKRQLRKASAYDISGGDGGESNSPARQSLSVQCNTCHLNKPSVTTYPNAPELDPKDDPTKLLPCLLDQIVAPGQFAQQPSLAFGGNGHHSDKLREVIQQLTNKKGTAGNE